MFIHAKTKLLFALTISALGLGAFGAASIASGIITPATGDDFVNDFDNTFSIAGYLPPLNITIFTEVAPADIQAPDARPIALFNAATAQTAKWAGVYFVGVYDPVEHRVEAGPGTPDPYAKTLEEYTNDEISFGILSTLKYTLPDGDVLVSTGLPNPRMLQHKLYLGQQAITLANGTPAWASKMEEEYEGIGLVTAAHKDLYFPNRVTFVQGDLLITVASALPMERVQELAAEVVLK